jgi:hypothetical protein
MTNPPAIEEGLTPAMIEAWAQYEPADGFDVANESTYNEVIVHMRHAFMSGMRAALSVTNDDVERLREALELTQKLVADEYAYAKGREQKEPNSPYREGAADAVCDVMNSVNDIARAALADRP